MNKHHKERPTQFSNKSIDSILVIGFIILIILHVFGGFWHSYFSWGLSYWSLFTTNEIAISGVVLILILIGIYFKPSNIDKLSFTVQSKTAKILLYVFGFICLSFIFYTFRLKSHFYGDGFLLLDKILDTQSILSESKNYMELLTIYFYYFANSILLQFGSFSTEIIIATINSIAGAFGIWAVWSISNLLTDNKSKSSFIFIACLTSASILLFFGYIENYTLAFVSALWTLRFTIGYLKNINGFLPLLFFSFVSIAFHLITLPFSLVALYSIMLRSNKEFFIDSLSPKIVLLSILLGSVLLVYLSQLKGLTIFVPLWSIAHNSYSLFSFEHITDILNQLILVAPLVIVLAVFAFRKNKHTSETDNSLKKILFLLSYLTFLSASLIDPQLGAARDWDLLSFYGVPLTIYLAFNFTLLFDGKKFINWISIAIVIIVIVHIIPNIYEKNNPNLAIAHLDKILWDDPHYQNDYQKAYRGLSWGLILQEHTTRSDLSEKYFLRISSLNEKDASSFLNLGLLHIRNNQLDSALFYLQKGESLNQNSLKILTKLSEVEFKLQHFGLSESFARRALKIDSNFVAGLTALAIVLTSQNKMEEALQFSKRVYDLEPEDFNHIKNLGNQFANGINIDSALYYYKKALPFAQANQKFEVLATLVSINIYLNQIEDAKIFLNQLKTLAPNSPVVKELENELMGKK